MIKLLLMAASVREGSCNKQLIELLTKLNLQIEVTTTKLDFATFAAPLYDGNLEAKQGIPEIIHRFNATLAAADGIIIASPEYNFSTPAPLKNLIDWSSRVRPMPWLNYPVMLCSASPAPVGGNRGLLHTATTLQFCCGARIFPALFSLGNAYEAFTADGTLKDPALMQKLAQYLQEFSTEVQANKAHKR